MGAQEPRSLRSLGSSEPKSLARTFGITCWRTGWGKMEVIKTNETTTTILTTGHPVSSRPGAPLREGFLPHFVGGIHHLKSLLLSPYPAIPPYAVRTPHPGSTDDREHITSIRCTQVYPSVPRYTQALARVPRCTRVYPGAPRCTQMYPGAPRCTQVYPGVPRCTQVHPGVPRCTQVYPGVPRCTQVHPGASRCTQVHPGAPRCTQVYPGVPRCTQVHPGVPRCTQVYCTQVYPGVPGCTHVYPGVPRGTRGYPGVPTCTQQVYSGGVPRCPRHEHFLYENKKFENRKNNFDLRHGCLYRDSLYENAKSLSVSIL